MVDYNKEWMEEEFDGNARIKVIGVGGGGCNAVNHMVSMGEENVEHYVINTDNQALKNSVVPKENRLRISEKSKRKGLGAGGNPEVGQRAAEECEEEIREILDGADMVFITAGMGGGTGTGAAPVVANIASEMGVITTAVVTKPFLHEGGRRMKVAETGIDSLEESVNTMIIIPNDKLREMVEKEEGGEIELMKAFQYVDDVLRYAVKGITDLIMVPGRINLDFSDIQTVMEIGGQSLMGIGSASGEDRTKRATLDAMKNPLLEHGGVDNAEGMIINLQGGSSVTFKDFDDAMTVATEYASEDAVIMMGTSVDEGRDNDDSISVTIVATGFNPKSKKEVEPRKDLSLLKKRESERVVSEGVEEEDQYDIQEDIPTFLRNRGVR